MNTSDPYATILSVLRAPKIDLRDVPFDDPIAVLGKTCETLFTNGVDVLRSLVPNERVRALSRVIWDLVEHKQVLVVLGSDVRALAFVVQLHRGVQQGFVLIPQAWPEMVVADPFMQLGAILFVGTQVVDFYNDRLIGDPGAEPRWLAYEAEFLRTLGTWLPEWSPNAYQREALAKYPDGINTAGVELYAYKPYAPPPRGAA